MAAVQFCGREAIMAAFGAKGMETWAVFQGKEMLTAGQGGPALDSFLRMLEPGGSAATYVIRFYDDDEPADSIRKETEYHSCYYVKLTDKLYSSPGAVGAVADPVTAAIQARFNQRVMAAVNRELDGEDDDEEDESLSGLLKGLVKGFTQAVTKDPEKLVSVLQGIKGVFTGQGVGIPVSLAGTTQATRIQGNGEQKQAMAGEPSEADMLRLQIALDKLGKLDPDIITHLEKLAQVAETKPAMYKMALNMLDGL